MKNLLKTTLLAGVLGVVALSQTGCLLVAAAAATGGTVAYMKGDLETSVDSSPDKVAAATKLALEEMNLRVISASGSSLDGDVLARTAADDKVHVVIKAQGEKTSTVSIRIGYFGDQAMSNRILQKINEKLKDPAVADGSALAIKPTTQPSTGTTTGTTGSTVAGTPKTSSGTDANPTGSSESRSASTRE